MPRAKRDTIEAMGLENFINTKFAYLEPKFGMKPYQKYLDIIPWPDSKIAAEFSTPERKLKPQTVSYWRQSHVREITGRKPRIAKGETDGEV